MLFSGLVWPYEDDVHYGLTKWLAIKADLSLAQAEIIAKENVMVDGRATSAVSLVAFYACLGTDQKGSELVRENHFPTTGPVPSAPSSRIVSPDSKVARKVALDSIQSALSGSPDDERYNLEQLGAGLHRLQDSFSHQGIPDVPHFLIFKCDETYAWAHPASRHGWDKHDADITSLFPEDADAMAMATYEVLCRFKLKTTHSACATNWAKLAPKVKEFNRASSKSAKLRWFDGQSSGLIACEALSHINVPDGAGWKCSDKRAAKRAGTSLIFSKSDASMPSNEIVSAENATAFVSAALETWLVKGDTASLAEYYVDQTSYLARLEAHGFPTEDRSLSLTKYFALALIDDGNRTADQTQIASAMSFTRTYGADGSSRIAGLQLPDGQQKPDKPVPSFFVYESLSTALLPISGKEERFEIVPMQCQDNPKDTCAVAVAVLKDRAPEYLILELRKTRKQWRIVGDYSFDPY